MPRRPIEAPAGEAIRSIVLWFPDWPVTALAREGAVDPAAAVAVFERNEVVACSAAARAEGVRRGQRRRDAQARCPRLEVIPADAMRDQQLDEDRDAEAAGVEVVVLQPRVERALARRREREHALVGQPVLGDVAALDEAQRLQPSQLRVDLWLGDGPEARDRAGRETDREPS